MVWFVRFWVGRAFVRVGLRVLGLTPGRSVIFHSSTWTDEGLAVWAARAQETGGRPDDLGVVVPAASYEAYQAAVDAAQFGPPVPLLEE